MKKEGKRINDQLLERVSEEETLMLKSLMRVTPVSCIILSSLGIVFCSYELMWIAAATTLVGAFTRNSLYDRVYNMFAEKKVPEMGVARSIGCGIGALVLGSSGFFFFTGQTTAGTITGSIMVVVASIAALSQLCFVSLVINLFRKDKIACCNNTQ